MERKKCFEVGIGSANRTNVGLPIANGPTQASVILLWALELFCKMNRWVGMPSIEFQMNLQSTTSALLKADGRIAVYVIGVAATLRHAKLVKQRLLVVLIR